MRLTSILFGTKLAAIFSLIGLVLLFANIFLGRFTVGEYFHNQLARLQCVYTSLIAEEYERRLEENPLDSRRSKILLNELSQTYNHKLAVHDLEGRRQASTTVFSEGLQNVEQEEIPCEPRHCTMYWTEPGRTFITPLMHDNREIGSFVLFFFGPDPHVFIHFAVGILLIHFLALLTMIGISYRITQPLRQVSRSMDKIAGGNLNERVNIRGRDEIARMGSSFNSMADRVEGMIQGSKEILAGVSHELRSPLSRMKLSLEMLRVANASEKHVRSIEEDVDELDQMVDELLTASRLDLGTATLRPESVTLVELVEESWQRVALCPNGDAIELQLHLSSEELSVLVDRSLGTRLLGNLFENAARYGEGSPISLSAYLREKKVIIEVADQGPGVDNDALENLFMPFYRADASRSRRTGGTGLGLMIAKRAVEAHGGSISAANRPEGGLVVTFDLPAAELTKEN